jgi:pimeloyl-ACP methyl ester carboxylesterase
MSQQRVRTNNFIGLIILKRRIGNLFYNPGGPGGRSSNRLALMLTGFAKVHPEIRDRFDIIGVDIRGTGLSNPIKCDINLYNEIHGLPW